MNYITVKDKKITGHYCGDLDGVPQDQGQVIEAPDQNEIVVDYYIDEYELDYKLRPLSDRIADGSARWVPENMTCTDDSNELRFKTRVELIYEGKEQLLPHEKIVEDQIVEKTLEEKLTDELITQEEYDQIKQDEKDSKIKGEVDGNLSDWLIQGLTWEEMQTEVQKIKDANKQ